MSRPAFARQLEARRASQAARGRRPPRLRTGPLPRQRAPAGVQLAYLQALTGMLDTLQGMVRARLLPKLDTWVRRVGRATPAATDRADDHDEVDAELAAITRDFLSRFPNDRLAALTATLGQRISQQQREDLGRQFKAAVGVDVVLAEPDLAGALKLFTRENVALIQDVPAQLLSELRTMLPRGLRAGQRHEELAADIEERFGVAKSRAALIAVDQCGKLYSEVNAARQQAAGVDSFIWRTSQDNRVRAAHVALEGKTFKWSEPPAEGIPGAPCRCRCTAEPALQDFFGSL